MFTNTMQLAFKAISQNEAFARAVVGAFAAQLNPTLEELSDIRTAVSEAVTNAIIHGYGSAHGDVRLCCGIEGSELTIEIGDDGAGIADIEKVRS